METEVEVGWGEESVKSEEVANWQFYGRCFLFFLPRKKGLLKTCL